MRVSGSGVHWCADMDGDECKERERKTGARVVNMYVRADLLHVDAD